MGPHNWDKDEGPQAKECLWHNGWVLWTVVPCARTKVRMRGPGSVFYLLI